MDPLGYEANPIVQWIIQRAVEYLIQFAIDTIRSELFGSGGNAGFAGALSDGLIAGATPWGFTSASGASHPSPPLGGTLNRGAVMNLTNFMGRVLANGRYGHWFPTAGTGGFLGGPLGSWIGITLGNGSASITQAVLTFQTAMQQSGGKFVNGAGASAFAAIQDPDPIQIEVGDVVGTVVDFIPIVGDAKAFYEAYKDPTPINVTVAIIGVFGPLGDAAGKALKAGAKLADAAESASDAAKSGQKLLASPRKHLLDSVADQKLRNRIDALYRPNAKVGSGSTADAILHELRTGELLSPKRHFQKGIEMRNGLMKDLKSGRLNDADSAMARRTLKYLQNALSGQ